MGGVSAAEYITKEDHNETVRRLDAADIELRAMVISLEDRLRTDYEDKIATAVTSVKEDLKDDIAGVQDHLTWQDRTVGAALITALALALIHFAFGVAF